MTKTTKLKLLDSLLQEAEATLPEPCVPDKEPGAHGYKNGRKKTQEKVKWRRACESGGAGDLRLWQGNHLRSVEEAAHHGR